MTSKVRLPYIRSLSNRSQALQPAQPWFPDINRNVAQLRRNVIHIFLTAPQVSPCSAVAGHHLWPITRQWQPTGDKWHWWADHIDGRQVGPCSTRADQTACQVSLCSVALIERLETVVCLHKVYFYLCSWTTSVMQTCAELLPCYTLAGAHYLSQWMAYHSYTSTASTPNTQDDDVMIKKLQNIKWIMLMQTSVHVTAKMVIYAQKMSHSHMSQQMLNSVQIPYVQPT